jgi:hypothetical protein
MTAQPEREIPVSLDVDLVETVSDGPAVQTDDAPREAMEEQRRHSALVELLDELEKAHGPVDQRAVARYKALLAE